MSDVVWAGIINAFFFAVASAFCAGLKLPLYHPAVMYTFYYAVGYVIRPIVVYLSGESGIWAYIGYDPDIAGLLKSSLVTNVGLICFVIVPYLFYKPSYCRPLIPRLEFEVRHPNRMAVAMFILGSMGLLGLWSAYGAAGSGEVLGYATTIDADGGQRLEGVSGYQTAAAEFLPAIIILIVALKGFNRSTLAIIALFICLRVWIGAGRNAYMIVLLGCMYLYLINRGLRLPKPAHLLMGVLAFFAFDIVGSNRLAFRQVLSGDLNFSSVFDGYAEARGGALMTSDVQEFDVATALLSVVPERTGYNWGSQYLRILVWPIPRQLWPDKPVYTAAIDINEAGNYFGLTWSMGVDFYSNFGMPSLILCMAAVGLVLGRLLSKAASLATPFSCLAYIVIASYFPLLFRDGVVTVIYYVGFALLATWILLFVGGVGLKSAGTGDSHYG